MKVCVVYETNSRALHIDCGAGDVLAVCSSYEKAKERVKEWLEENKKCNYLPTGAEVENTDGYYNIVYLKGDEDRNEYSEIEIKPMVIDEDKNARYLN